MTAPTSQLKRPHRPLPGASPRFALPNGLGKYEFQVVAASVADVVMSIGGLIFDRAMAGWDVGVVVDGSADRAVDDRPIRILGGRVAMRLLDPNDVRALSRPTTLAVATDLMIKSDAVRRHVLEMGDDRETVVLLWGRHHPTTMSRTFVAARHRPSAAAHLFKSHALVAARATAIPQSDEGLYSMS